jgi:cellulose synthase/poly-beta-1,6-N-acetylglucosamine synthase-like glycosyltransferase
MKWVFWGAVCLIIYAYFGYAGWLWVRSRWRRRPVSRSSYTPAISIVMVVRNEANVLENKLQNLLNLNYPGDLVEIVVASDGSTDGTNQVLSQYAKIPRVRAVFLAPSRGKAAGLNEAVAITRGDIVVFTDARQKIEADAVRLLLENFIDATVGCASGELMLGDPDRGETARGMGLYWRIEKRIRELEAASGSVVGATGAIYAVRRELLVRLPE